MRPSVALSFSALCFLTRTTCSVVPVFDDLAPVRQRQPQWRSQGSSKKQEASDGTLAFMENQAKKERWSSEKEGDDRWQYVKDYLEDQVRQCMADVPRGHELIVGVSDRWYGQPSLNKSDASSGGAAATDESFAGRKRLVKTFVKTWKGMPTQQRLQVISTVAGATTVPMYLASSVQGLDEVEIKKIKLNAAKAQLDSSKRASVAVHRSSAPIAPPPMSSIPHRRRDVSMIEQEAHYPGIDPTTSAEESLLYGRGLPSRVPGLGHGRLSNGEVQAVFDEFKASYHSLPHVEVHPASSSGVHVPSSAASTASNAGSATGKKNNPTVDRLLGWVGMSTGLMYVPIAASSLVKTRRIVSKDDLQKYRRRQLTQGEDQDMPLVTCIPIPTDGEQDALTGTQVHNEAALNQLAEGREMTDDLHLQKRAGVEKVGKTGMQALGSNAKLAGIGFIGTVIGYTLHRLGQRRSVDPFEDREGMLVRRNLVATDDTAVSSNDNGLQKRFWGKGTILFSGILAGSALSRAGAGLPKLHPTLVENEGSPKKAKRSLDESSDPAAEWHRRGGIGRVLNDKVTLTVGSIVAGFVGIKSGLFGRIGHAVKNPKLQPPPGAPAPPAKRSLHDDSDDDQVEVHLYRRIGRGLAATFGLLGGIMIAQRTGKMGQKRENEQYKKQLGLETPKPARRSLSEIDSPSSSDPSDIFKRCFPNHYVPGTLAAVAIGAIVARKAFGKSAADKEKGASPNSGAIENVKRSNIEEDEEGLILERRSPGAGGKAVGETLTHTVSDLKGYTVSLSAKVGKALKDAGRSLSHNSRGGRSLKHGLERSSSSSSSALKLARQESIGSTASSRSNSLRHLERSTHSRGLGVERSTQTHQTLAPSGKGKVKVIHHHYHQPSFESAQATHGATSQGGAPHGVDASPAKKKFSKGKTLAFGSAGAVIGAGGHALYTNGKQNIANQEAAMVAAAEAPSAAPSAAGAEAAAAGGNAGATDTSSPAAAKRADTSETLSPDITITLQKRSWRSSSKIIHEHHFHHYIPSHSAVSESHLTRQLSHIKPPKVSGGGGKGKAIGALVVGGIMGVLGHTLWNNVSNKAPPPSPPAEESGAAPPVQKRDVLGLDVSREDDTILVRRKFGFGHVLSGALIGTGAAAYAYALAHDSPGTRQKHTVPKGTLPQPEQQAGPQKRSFPFAKRGVDGGLVAQSTEQAVQKRGGSGMMGVFKSLSSKAHHLITSGGRASKASAIAAGIGISTAAALVDPGAKEAKMPSVQRRDLSEATLDQSRRGVASITAEGPEPQLLSKRALNVKALFAPITKAYANLGAKYGQHAQHAVVVSGVAGVAGMANLMRRDAGTEDDENGLGRLEKRTFERHAGKMMDYGTIALIGGSLVRNVWKKMTGKTTPPAEAAGAKKRASLIVLTDDLEKQESMLVRRRLIEDGLGDTPLLSTSVVQLSKAIPSTKLNKTVKNLLTRREEVLTDDVNVLSNVVSNVASDIERNENLRRNLAQRGRSLERDLQIIAIGARMGSRDRRMLRRRRIANDELEGETLVKRNGKIGNSATAAVSSAANSLGKKGVYKWVNIASFATIGGSILAPVIKQFSKMMGGKGQSGASSEASKQGGRIVKAGGPGKLVRRAEKEKTYDDYIEQVKENAKKVTSTSDASSKKTKRSNDASLYRGRSQSGLNVRKRAEMLYWYPLTPEAPTLNQPTREVDKRLPTTGTTVTAVANGVTFTSHTSTPSTLEKRSEFHPDRQELSEASSPPDEPKQPSFRSTVVAKANGVSITSNTVEPALLSASKKQKRANLAETTDKAPATAKPSDSPTSATPPTSGKPHVDTVITATANGVTFTSHSSTLL